MTTYLGLHDNRERVQWRVTQWHTASGSPTTATTPGGHPVFRFGDVYPAPRGRGG
jgi:hypothetical protein